MIGDYVRTRQKAQQEGGAYVCVRVTSKRTNIFVAVELFYAFRTYYLTNCLWAWFLLTGVLLCMRSSSWIFLLVDFFLNKHFRERNHSK